MAIERSEDMNVGEKITSYKEKNDHANFQEFGRAADVSGDWIKELSKKTEIKVTDMNNVVKLCRYLGIQIEQLVINDEDDTKVIEDNIVIDENSNDIGILLNQMVILMSRNELKMDGMPINDKAKQICKDALDVVRTLVKQHL